MKTRLATISAIIFAALTAALATGCNRTTASTTTATATTAAPAPAAHYKEGQGIQLTDTAQQFIGLETGEVTTHDIRDAKGVPAIPADALLRTLKGNFVFVANGAWLLRTEVKTGADDGAWIEIKDGLYEGDTIVTHGANALWLAELQAVNGGVGCADGD